MDVKPASFSFIIFPGSLTFVTTVAQAKAFEKKQKWPAPYILESDLIEGWAYTHSVDSTNQVLVYLNLARAKKEKWSKASLYGILAHEAVHVAEKTFRYIGESKPGEEIAAYLVGACTSFMISQLT